MAYGCLTIEILAGDQQQGTISACCSGFTAAELLAALSMDVRCGAGSLSDKDDNLLMGTAVLSSAGQPYKFRKVSAPAHGPGPISAEAAAAQGTPTGVAVFLKEQQDVWQLRSGKQRAANVAKRAEPIDVAGGGQLQELKDAGQYLALSSYDPALDHLLRSMSRMAKDFSEQSDIFITTTQLLRAIGAPGLGKSTFVNSAWSLLLPRLQAVKADRVRWEAWQELGVDLLLKRLESWQTELGPLVYVIDMSKNGLSQVHDQEKDLEPGVQVAARMLWAAVEMKGCANASYGTFLANLRLRYPNVLRRLTPCIVQYFVHLAAGLPADAPSLVVFVWDEANAVPADKESMDTTFFQAQLSAVVSSRVTIQEYKQDVDVMLVPVVASTRGSAMSLVRTASKKAGFVDLRLPLIKSVDDLALIVMDFMRRLPSSTYIVSETMTRDQPLSDMPEKVRTELMSRCPPHVRQLLDWVGSNPRLLVAALSILSSQSSRYPYNMRLGSLKWFTVALMPLDRALDLLLNTMEVQGWGKWLGSSTDRPLARILLQATTYGLCSMPVSRTTPLTPPGTLLPLTLQHLEADAVIELRPADGMIASSRSSSSNGAVDTASAQSEADEDSGSSKVFVFLPPLLLAAVLRNLVCNDCKGVALSFSTLCSGLATNWRKREFDDLGALTLRLQLLKDSLGCGEVKLCTLFRPLASTAMGDRFVLIPNEGFSPLTVSRNVNDEDVANFLADVAWPEEYKGKKDKQQPPWAVVFNGHNGPGDSMVVLRLCDDRAQPCGELAVLHIQSKLRTSSAPETASWDKIDLEGKKVHFLSTITSQGGQTAEVHQVFLYVSDESLPTGRGKRRAESSAGTSAWQRRVPSQDSTLSGSKLSFLAQGECVVASNGLPVVAVFHDSQWDLRGAVQSIKALLDSEVQNEAKLQAQLAAMSLRRGP